MNKKIILLVLAAGVAVAVMGGYKLKMPEMAGIFKKGDSGAVLNVEEAKKKALAFISTNLVEPGTKVETTRFVLEGDIYVMDLDINGQKVTAYMAKDGSKFFPSGMAMNASEKVAGDSKAPEAKDIPKSDKPQVELFVMSYCPYGTQIEKGILPVIKALGNKIDFKLKFVDYIMHEKKEADENLREFCIQKSNPEKLAAYLGCFLKKGEGTEESCMAEANISAYNISGCMTAADKEYKISENFGKKETWKGQFPPFDVDKADNVKYGVQGSPTLVINGVEASSSRDSAGLLKTICGAFSQETKECETELPSTAPAPGFGEGTSAGSSDASCGN